MIDYLAEMKSRTEAAEADVIRWLPENTAPYGQLTQAMRYPVEVGGKRIRPILMRETYSLYSGKDDAISPFAAAIEYIHTSSLVHDDLPAIDNDSLRRGKPSAHVQFGEAIGILAGDALLNYAYEVLLKGICLAPDKEDALKAAYIIARKAGFGGMLGGQDTDVEAEKKMIDGKDLDVIRYVYENKTAALIEASLMAGAAAAGAPEKEIERLEKTGHCIGMAFQIQDDILDIVGDQELLGKNVLSDMKNQKATYVSRTGLEASRKAVRDYTDKALALIDGIAADTEFLKSFVLSLASREK